MKDEDVPKNWRIPKTDRKRISIQKDYLFHNLSALRMWFPSCFQRFQVCPRAFCSKLQWLPCHCCLGRTHCHGAVPVTHKDASADEVNIYIIYIYIYIYNIHIYIYICLHSCLWILIWIPSCHKWWISGILLVKYVCIYTHMTFYQIENLKNEWVVTCWTFCSLMHDLKKPLKTIRIDEPKL